MARPRQPFCPKCLVDNRFVAKEKGAGYCTAHRREYQKNRNQSRTSEKEVSYLLDGDQYEAPTEMVQAARDDALAETRIKDIVYELTAPLVTIVAKHNEKMFTDLADLIEDTLKSYFDAATRSQMRVGGERARTGPDPLTDLEIPTEFVFDPDAFVEHGPREVDPEPEEQVFDMPDDWSARRGRMGPA